MYAVIRTGGKQYKVQAGDRVKVEKVDHDLGSTFDVTEVLLLGGETTVVGKPLVSNAKVTVVVTKQTKDRKVIVFKKKRRKGYRKFATHRQPYSELFVQSITSPDGKVTKAETEANVVDVDADRLARIQTKIKVSRDSKDPVLKKAAAASEATTTKKAAGPKKTTAAKKKVVKKTVKKVAKKAPSKTATKKAAAKATKKATKK